MIPTGGCPAAPPGSAREIGSGLLAPRLSLLLGAGPALGEGLPGLTSGVAGLSLAWRRLSAGEPWDVSAALLKWTLDSADCAAFAGAGASQLDTTGGDRLGSVPDPPVAVQPLAWASAAVTDVQTLLAAIAAAAAVVSAASDAIVLAVLVCLSVERSLRRVVGQASSHSLAWVACGPTRAQAALSAVGSVFGWDACVRFAVVAPVVSMVVWHTAVSFAFGPAEQLAMLLCSVAVLGGQVTALVAATRALWTGAHVLMTGRTRAGSRRSVDRPAPAKPQPAQADSPAPSRLAMLRQRRLAQE